MRKFSARRDTSAHDAERQTARRAQGNAQGTIPARPAPSPATADPSAGSPELLGTARGAHAPHDALRRIGAAFWQRVVLDGPADDPGTCWRYVGERRRDADRVAAADVFAAASNVARAGGATAADPASVVGMLAGRPMAPAVPMYHVQRLPGADDEARGRAYGSGRRSPGAWRPIRPRRVAWELQGYGSTDDLELSPVCEDPACCRPSHMRALRVARAPILAAVLPAARSREGVLAWLVGRAAAAAWYDAHPPRPVPVPLRFSQNVLAALAGSGGDAGASGRYDAAGAVNTAEQIGACVLAFIHASVVADVAAAHDPYPLGVPANARAAAEAPDAAPDASEAPDAPVVVVRCPWGTFAAHTEGAALRRALAAVPPVPAAKPKPRRAT